MGLDRETSKYLDTASGGSFLRVSANSGRSILTKVLESTPEEVEEKPLEKESQIAEIELLPNPSPTLAVPNPKPPEKEETPIRILCLNLRMNFLPNTKIPQIIIR
jgi:hypothetical protein